MDYKYKYAKYKHKYDTLKTAQKSLFAFIYEWHDTEIIIVEAIDEADAYEKLDKLTDESVNFYYSAEYAMGKNVTKARKYIIENKIKPIKIMAPMYFDFYNG